MEPHPDIRSHIQGEYIEIDEETVLRHLLAEESKWLGGDPKTLRLGEHELDSQYTSFEPEGLNTRMIKVIEWSEEHKKQIVIGLFAAGAVIYAFRRVQGGRKSK